MKNLHFYTGHRDVVGGGALALYYLAWALQDQFEVSLSCDPHPSMGGYEFLESFRRPVRIGAPSKIDVFLASSYTEQVPPQGPLNIFYTFYPRMPRPPGYQRVITLSEYSRKAVFDRWGENPKVLCGGVFADNYKPDFPKKKIIFNSSRFFIEGDADTFWGHSKNQHILISAFKSLQRAEDWKLLLAGSILTPGDDAYFRACMKLAGDDPRILFLPMASKEAVRDLCAQAKIFVHCMGYDRTDPAETEHYGFCVEKALLSGCYCLVHASGGAPELAHSVWWTPQHLVGELQGLIDKDVRNELLYEVISKRTLEDWRREVQETFAEWA